MILNVTEDGLLHLQRVYLPIILETQDGEKLTICMRDTGFELNYQGEMYFAKQGIVQQFAEKQPKEAISTTITPNGVQDKGTMDYSAENKGMRGTSILVYATVARSINEDKNKGNEK